MKTFSVYMRRAQPHLLRAALVNAWTAKGARRKWRRRMLERGPRWMLAELEVFEVKPRPPYTRPGWDEVCAP